MNGLLSQFGKAYRRSLCQTWFVVRRNVNLDAERLPCELKEPAPVKKKPKKITLDTKALVGSIKKTKVLPEVIADVDHWKTDTMKLVGGPRDAVDSVPRGQKISDAKTVKAPKKTKIPRGVKVSEFTSSEVKSVKEVAKEEPPIEKKKTTKKKAKTEEEAAKPKPEKKKTTKAKTTKKAEPQAESSNIIKSDSLLAEIKTEILANSVSPKEEVVPIVETTKATNVCSPEDERMFLKYLDDEHQSNKRKLFSRYTRLLGKYKIDEKFLSKSLPKYPLISLDMMVKNREQFDEIEFEIASQSLFKNSKANLSGVEIEKNGKDVSLGSTSIDYNTDKYILPSVTRITDLTMTEKRYQALVRWKLELMKTMGIKGFKDHQKDLQDRGTMIHKTVECLLKNEPFDAEFVEQERLHELVTMVKTDIKNPILIESSVVHHGLLYTGRIDCIAYYKNTLCIIDWKTSEKPKSRLSDTFDAPVQIAAYLGAFFNDPHYAKLRAEHKIDNAVIIYITKSGALNFHPINYQQAEFYWYEWLNQLRRFWYLVLKNVKQ